MKKIQNKLLSFQDLAYKDFHAKLMPTVSSEKIIGVRVPVLRKYAKELFKSGNYDNFLNDLPHFYYEENNLHAFLIEQINDFDNCIIKLEKFLPHVDNWATCDMLTPKCFNKNSEKLYQKIKEWLNLKSVYAIRYAIKTLMTFYLDDNFDAEHLELIINLKNQDYYVKMAVAWYMATALYKQYESAVKVLKNGELDVFTHNKSIQKAIESKRIESSVKEYLKSLKK